MKRLFLISLLCFVILFSLTGCKSKIALSTSDFKIKLESKNFNFTDITSVYDSSTIKKATLAKGDNEMEVIFFEVDSELDAKTVYDINKTSIENKKGDSTTSMSISVANYSFYKQISGGLFNYICRVDNTILYINVNDKYKNEAEGIIEELGY